MEKEFVPFKESLELKELGFDEPCFGWWLIEEEMLITEKSKESKSVYTAQAPVFQQALRWFRDKYGLESVVQRADDFVWYKWKISRYNEDDKKYVADWYDYKTYEEAELACLRKLIEIVKYK